LTSPGRSANLYVLEGSVHKAGHRVRITAQLVDALSGAHLWADRFDGSLEDIFKLRRRALSCRSTRCSELRRGTDEDGGI